MPETPEPALLHVPFCGTTLFIVVLDGRPYTPVRPIVEGMGLAWQPQHDKLSARKQRFCVSDVLMRMPGDDRAEKVCCLPLRKVLGWLMSISPKRHRSPLRRAIVTYQVECDDALWGRWAEHRDGAAADRPARNDLDELDNYTLAAECFQELTVLFVSIAHFAPHDDIMLATLARIGQDRADYWHQFYTRQSRQLSDRPRPQ